MRFFLIILFLSTFYCLKSQVLLDGHISESSNQKLMLAYYSGDRLYICDTTISDANGNFTFSVKNNHQGQYRLIVSKKLAVDFFYDGNRQHINTHLRYFTDSLQFKPGNTGELFYKIQNSEIIFNQKMDLLSEILDKYPEQDDFYKSTGLEFMNIQYTFHRELENAIDQCNNNVLKRYLASRRQTTIPYFLKADERKSYLRDHALDKVSFTDTILNNTDAWSRRIIEYLSLYSDPSMDKTEIQASFIMGLQKIKPSISVNPIVFSFITNYLIEGFERYGFEDVLLFMADQYRPQTCDNPGSLNIQDRLEAIKRLSIGNIAPPISGFDSNGKKFKGDELKYRPTLVIFWASWCPHCNHIMPQLINLYNQNKQKNWGILAFSIDTDRNAWVKAINEHAYPWPNISDLKGWDGDVSKAWALNATPVFYLIDKDLRIIAKPNNLQEIIEALNQIKK